MENFTLYNPSCLYFGKGVIKKLGKSIEKTGKRVLLVYGKGSVKSSGAYDAVMEQLRAAGAEVFEYCGIKSNPLIDDVEKAVALGREKSVDVVLALGGGSVIDSAKVISIGIPVSHSPWEFVTGKLKPQKAVPLIAVLTLAATGSEMNQFAVVQNTKTMEKIGFGNPFMYPCYSFLDPEYTLTVPLNYTAYGVADLIAHSLEAWFGKGDASLSDRFVISIIHEAMKYGPLLLDNLNNYDLRARIMYAATSALNGLTAYGRVSPDWGVHDIGHILSVMYDIPHGASLSIAYPAWMKLHKDRAANRIKELGIALFNAENTDDTIYKLESFFRLIQCPLKLSEAGVKLDKDGQDQLIERMKINKANGLAHPLSDEDYPKLVEWML